MFISINKHSEDSSALTWPWALTCDLVTKMVQFIFGFYKLHKLEALRYIHAVCDYDVILKQ